MLKTQWENKKRENLIVLAVLLATLLAVFLISRGGQETIQGLVKRLGRPAVIRWEKGNAETLNVNFWKRAKNTEKEILALVKDLQGIYGVYIEDLETGLSLGINQDQVFTAASLIKLPVLVAVYQDVEKGNLSLTTSYKLQAKDKVSGAGSMHDAPAGTVYTYGEMLKLMGKQSDNTAFNVFVGLLGKEKIQAVINELGMGNTSFAKNETTPADMGRFFREVYGGNRVNWENREKIYDHLTDTIWEDRIPAGIPNGMRVAHKVGTEVGVISDAGIVFGKRPFILIIMSEGVKETEAKEILPKIASVIYSYIHPNP